MSSRVVESVFVLLYPTVVEFRLELTIKFGEWCNSIEKSKWER